MLTKICLNPSKCQNEIQTIKKDVYHSYLAISQLKSNQFTWHRIIFKNLCSAIYKILANQKPASDTSSK